MLIAVVKLGSDGASGQVVENRDPGPAVIATDGRSFSAAGEHTVYADGQPTVVAGFTDHTAPDGCIFVAVGDKDLPSAGPGAAWSAQGGFVAAPVPPPPPVTSLAFLGFIALFDAAEQAAIVNATDTRIKLFCLMAAGADAVNLTDPRTVGGVDLLESLGLIAKGRAAQVLAGQAPPSA